MDGSRPLTDDGIAQAEQMGEWLAREHGRVDIVICSPFERGQQTAEIMAAALGSHVADTRLLQPDAAPADAWAEIERLAQQSTDVLVVGHDPSINELLMWLLGQSGGVPEVRFEHGSIAHIGMKNSPATLHWLVSPKLVAKEDQAELEEAAIEIAESMALERGVTETVSLRIVSELEDGGLLCQIESL